MCQFNMESQDCTAGTGTLLVLDPKPFKPFKSKDEYLYAMKEDLSEWFYCLYQIDITVENFFENIETGFVLCNHAINVQNFAQERRDLHPELEIKSNFIRDIPEGVIPCRSEVRPGTFQARDNISNFISWCRRLGIPQVLLFETDDLVMRKNERSVVLCLLEVARIGAKLGMLAPVLVQMEQEIEAELAGDPPPQIKTCDLRSLDEMVRDLVGRCTCPSQFPIIKVGEGKYKIGDSQTLIFVRILRNHVMVRVGGGWDTLENYLDKHDPCRCGYRGHRSSPGPGQYGKKSQGTNRRMSAPSKQQNGSLSTRSNRSMSVAGNHPSISPIPNHSGSRNMRSPSSEPRKPRNLPSSVSLGSLGNLSQQRSPSPISRSTPSTAPQQTHQKSSLADSSRRSKSPGPSRLRSPSPVPSFSLRIPSPSPHQSNARPATPVRRSQSPGPCRPSTLSVSCAKQNGTLNDPTRARRKETVTTPVTMETNDQDITDNGNINMDHISTMTLSEFKNLLSTNLSVPNCSSSISSDSPRSLGSTDSPRTQTKGSKPTPNTSSQTSLRPPASPRRAKSVVNLSTSYSLETSNGAAEKQRRTLPQSPGSTGGAARGRCTTPISSTRERSSTPNGRVRPTTPTSNGRSSALAERSGRFSERLSSSTIRDRSPSPVKNFYSKPVPVGRPKTPSSSTIPRSETPSLRRPSTSKLYDNSDIPRPSTPKFSDNSVTPRPSSPKTSHNSVNPRPTTPKFSENPPSPSTVKSCDSFVVPQPTTPKFSESLGIPPPSTPEVQCYVVPRPSTPTFSERSGIPRPSTPKFTESSGIPRPSTPKFSDSSGIRRPVTPKFSDSSAGVVDTKPSARRELPRSTSPTKSNVNVRAIPTTPLPCSRLDETVTMEQRSSSSDQEDLLQGTQAHCPVFMDAVPNSNQGSRISDISIENHKAENIPTSVSEERRGYSQVSSAVDQKPTRICPPSPVRISLVSSSLDVSRDADNTQTGGRQESRIVDPAQRTIRPYSAGPRVLASRQGGFSAQEIPESHYKCAIPPRNNLRTATGAKKIIAQRNAKNIVKSVNGAQTLSKAKSVQNLTSNKNLPESEQEEMDVNIPTPNRTYLQIYAERSRSRTKSDGAQIRQRPKSAGPGVSRVLVKQGEGTRTLVRQNAMDDNDSAIVVNRGGAGHHSITIKTGSETTYETRKANNRPSSAKLSETMPSSTTVTPAERGRSRELSKSVDFSSRRLRPKSADPRSVVQRAAIVNPRDEPDSKQRSGMYAGAKFTSTSNLVRAWEDKSTPLSDRNKTGRRQLPPSPRRSITPGPTSNKENRAYQPVRSATPSILDDKELLSRPLSEIKAALRLPINGVNKITVDPTKLDAPPEDPVMYQKMEELFHKYREKEMNVGEVSADTDVDLVSEIIGQGHNSAEDMAPLANHPHQSQNGELTVFANGNSNSEKSSEDGDDLMENGGEVTFESTVIAQLKDILKPKPRKDPISGLRSRIPAPQSRSISVSEVNFTPNLETNGPVFESSSKSEQITLNPRTYDPISFVYEDHSLPSSHNELVESGVFNSMSDLHREDSSTSLSDVSLSSSQGGYRSETPVPKLATPLCTGRSTLFNMRKNRFSSTAGTGTGNSSRLVRAVSLDHSFTSTGNTSMPDTSFSLAEDEDYV